DSYQEEDLERMREQWLATLTQRQEYLDQQLQKIVSKQDKSEDDLERESQLLECRLTLTEERNAVLVPSAGSGIPGAPVERVPVPGMETHIPVLFLDLSADDFQSNLSAPLAGGVDAYLAGEYEDDFFDLHVVKHDDSEVKVEASWDSTVHDCPELSRVASGEQRVYLTIRVVVELSHPAHMQLILRKRICVNVTGKKGFAQSLLKRMSQRSTIPGCGVTFEIVSNIPGDFHGPEDREMLARLAASADDDQSGDSEAAIEKYLRSVLAVENILTLDRLRQEVTVREQLALRGKVPRRCLSSPNVNRLSVGNLDVFASTHKLGDFKGWESHQDLSAASAQSRRTLPSSISHSLTPDKVKPVPNLLKSLISGGKEDSGEQATVHQQVGCPEPQQDRIDVFDLLSTVHNVPRIMVQSASVEEGMNTRRQVPTEEISPPAIHQESPRLVPLPPPIIPETEDSTQSSMSEASSGYISTSISTATLSDVYTLSWDHPPSSGQKADSYEAVTDEEENKVIQRLSLQSDSGSGSEPQEFFQAATEDTNLPQSKPNHNSSDLNQQKPNPSLVHEVKAPSLCVDSNIPPTVHLEHRSMESAQSDGELSLTNSFIVQVQQPTDSKPKTSVTGTVQMNTKESTKAIQEVLKKNEQSKLEEPAQMASEPSIVPLGDSDPLACPQEKSSLKNTSAFAISTPSNKVHLENLDASAEPNVQPSESAAAVKPFKIQKVQSSDLKSFQRILGDSEGEPVQTDTCTSTKSDSNLAEPLELILDCEEGEAASAVILPDWIKEGEFVTVGTNKRGIVRYVGPTDFAEGMWVGVELEVPAGKNDGSVGGKHYFHCNPGYGVLVRPDRVTRGGGKRRRQQQKRRSANLSGSAPNLATLTALAKGASSSRNIAEDHQNS
ncbi:kinesin-like protein KIF13B, partial [Syngnathus typhle]